MQSKCVKRAMTLAVSASLWASLAQAYEYDGNTNTLTVRSVEAFGRCAQETGSSQACLDGLQRYVDEQPEDALSAAKRVRLEYNHFAALPFFANALQQKGATGICTDEDLRLAVISGLALPTDYPQVTIATKIAQDSCWTELQAQIESGIKTQSGYYLPNACPILLAKGGAVPDCEIKQDAATETDGLDPEMKALQSLKWKKVKLDSKSPMVFRGAGNEEVFMARAAAPNDNLYLVKLKSIRGDWRDRVFAMRERPTGADGLNYVTVVDDREYVLLTVRNGHYEVYPDGYPNGVGLHEVRLLKSDDVLEEFRFFVGNSGWMSIAF